MKANNRHPHTFRVSTVRQLAFRFSLLLAAIIALLSSGIILLLRMSIRNQQNRELAAAAETVAAALQNGRIGEIDGELPYYITFAVYESATKEITVTNDPFLPALPVTPNRAERYTAKQYFSDGDLNILYYATEVNGMSTTGGTGAASGMDTAGIADGYVIQTALNMDTDTTEAILSGLPRMLALIGIPLLFISYGAAFVISARTMRTVRTMTQAAQKISTSNLGERLPVTDKRDDFDELAKTFNSLLSRLQTDFARERQFTADVSHELKTPLAVILGHANLLRRWGKDDPGRLEQSLAALIREAHSMQSIIENLLRIARFENGSIAIKPAPLSLPALFERLMDDTKAYAPGVTIDTHIEVQTVHTDSELLHQACTVIISNSVKFAGEHAHITLSAHAAVGGAIRISIADNGPGIGEETLPHIFERFYRGDAAHVRSAGGAGLGLSIVKSIMHALGGSVHAESGKGKGAVIVMQLPDSKTAFQNITP